MKELHLICNAHIDPSWQWDWEEGTAETLSTFRIAADFCDDFDGFVFCHNEALLYEWVEKYDPTLFTRIQRLVKEKRWHIMGGWYLQPDCNMPSGEGLMRQCMVGRKYFSEKFDVVPTIGINFDSFGHSRGVVQILTQNGYSGYLFTRPAEQFCTLPASAFEWVGYDGSSVKACRAQEGYNSAYGQAVSKIRWAIDAKKEENISLCLWGVGNHGGGPSRKDLQEIGPLIQEYADAGLVVKHSTPEAFFEARKDETLPKVEKALTSWAPGCYTSQIRIKQQYRKLENELFMAEKMASAAAMAGRMAYPAEKLALAERMMLLTQFHDCLPGSSVQSVEESGLRKLQAGLEAAYDVKADAFFSMLGGFPAVQSEETPIFVYNPHPYPVEGEVDCEYMLWLQNWDDTFYLPTVYDEDGNILPSQQEKEQSNISLDWRKRVVFHATLPPAKMSRFIVRFEIIPGRQRPILPADTKDDNILFDNGQLHAEISCKTGLIEKLTLDGVSMLSSGAGQLHVYKDSPDPWGMEVQSFPERLDSFTLLSSEETARICGLEKPIPAVRVVENGAVRMVVEAIFGYQSSYAVVRYILPKLQNEPEMEIRLVMNELHRMIKLALPTGMESPSCIGQVPYGYESMYTNGMENVSQKVMMFCDAERAVALINDGVYGSSVEGSTLLQTLLRTAAYTAHPIGDRPILPVDRYTAHTDIGEHKYRFKLLFGKPEEVKRKMGRDATTFGERPMALSAFPILSGERLDTAVEMQGDQQIELSAMFRKGDDLQLRLFNPLDREAHTVVCLPLLGQELDVTLPPCAVRTFTVGLAE